MMASDLYEALLEAAFRTGSFDYAEESAREDERLLRGEHRGVARARIQLGLIRHYASIRRRRNTDADANDGEDAAAAEEEALFRSALTLAEATADKACAAAALLGIGLVEQVARRDWNEAMPYYRRAEALIPELRIAGDWYAESEIHRRLGLYFLAADPRPDRAAHHLGLAHAVSMQNGDAMLIPSTLTALSAAERARGAYARAVAYAGEAARRAAEAGLSAVWVTEAAEELRAAEAALAAAPTALPQHGHHPLH
jgi:tetratricopeptide (TPR) repeat protein